MEHRFIGNSICCGTYSIIQIIESNIDVDLFELTTGVPFGIKGSIEEGRLLTTFVNPNYGLEIGMNIWGIKGKKYHYKDKERAWEKFCDMFKLDRNIIIGPLDMLRLSYIPLSTMYIGMDHYVSIQKHDDYHVLVKDSEGYLAVPVDLDTLFKMWDICNVIEAEGEYCFRTVDIIPGRHMERKKLLQKAYKLMRRNVCWAEAACYGSHTFSRIVKYVENDINTGWRTGLMYDFTHLLQRKVITKQMLEELMSYDEEMQYDRLLSYIDNQLDILPFLYKDVEEGRTPSRCLMNDMGIIEKEIYKFLKEQKSVGIC